MELVIVSEPEPEPSPVAAPAVDGGGGGGGGGAAATALRRTGSLDQGRVGGRAVTPRFLPASPSGLAWKELSDSDEEAERAGLGEGVPFGSKRPFASPPAMGETRDVTPIKGDEPQPRGRERATTTLGTTASAPVVKADRSPRRRSRESSTRRIPRAACSVPALPHTSGPHARWHSPSTVKFRPPPLSKVRLSLPPRPLVAVPSNYRLQEPPTLDAVPARRLRRLMSSPGGSQGGDSPGSHHVSPGLSMLRDDPASRSSFPAGEESRSDWALLRHMQADLDERSKSFHEKQFAGAAAAEVAGGGAGASSSSGGSPSRRHSSAGGTPIRTPGRSGLLGPAAGRDWHERAVPLGTDFWVELKGAVYGVDRIQTQLYIDEQQRAVLGHTVTDVLEFESSDTGGHQAKTMLGRLDAARELFETEKSLTDAISRNPTTRLKDFQEKEEVLALWYNADVQLSEFRGRCDKHIKWFTGFEADRWRTPVAPDGTPWTRLDKVTQTVDKVKPDPLLFAKTWAKRLESLLAEYHKRSSLRRAVGLPSLSGKFGAAMMLLMRLVHSLAQKDSAYVGESTVGQFIQLAKELLSMNCASDAGRWRAHLRELERSDYDKMVSQLFERYFDIIRSPGWSFRPEVRITSWLQADIQKQVAKRVESLESEWTYLTDLLPKLQVIVPDAEKHFVIGMMTLSQALLRDVRILCSKGPEEDAAASEVSHQPVSPPDPFQGLQLPFAHLREAHPLACAACGRDWFLLY